MRFQDRPVSRIDELHGDAHRRALRELRKNVEAGKFVALLGPRRVGKTSILRTFLNTYSYHYIYYDLSPYIGSMGVSYTSLTPAKINIDLKKLSGEAEINLGVLKFSVREVKGVEYENSLINLLREIDEKYERFLLIFDEAQVLGFIRGVNMLGVLQMIHNTMDHISVIMTGSMPGLLEKILSPSSQRAMFARYVERIEVKRWSKSEAREYLEDGFHELGICYEEYEIEEAIEELSTVPGFLALYGLERSGGKTHSEALKEAGEKAVLLWIQDLEAFFSIYKSESYLRVLSILAQSSLGYRWGEIMREMKRFEDINNSKLYRMLNNLIGAGMIEKRDKKYFIPERPLRKAILRFKRVL